VKIVLAFPNTVLSHSPPHVLVWLSAQGRTCAVYA